MKMPRLFLLLAVCVFASALSGCVTGKKSTSGSGSDADYVNGTPLPERQEGVSFSRVDDLDQMSRAEKDLAITRLTMTADTRLVMPPPLFRTITPAERELMVQELQQ